MERLELKLMKNIPQLILTVGCPGTGKTTWAKEYVRSNDNVIRFSRDDYRKMLFNVQMGNYEQENAITTIINSNVKMQLEKGINVIIDATHVKRKYIKDVIDSFGHLADISFKVFDVDLSSLQELLKRNNMRPQDERVPDTVLLRMFESYKFLKNNFDLTTIIKRGTNVNTNDYINDIKVIRNDALPPAIIVDVDGTLAEICNRDPHDWKNVINDKPKHDVINIVNTLSTHYHIIIFTGRDGRALYDTEKWLKIHSIPYDEIYIRPMGDNRKDSIVKAELFNENINGKYNVIGVIDDRDQVVEMWRKIGLTCFQVDYGNF